MHTVACDTGAMMILPWAWNASKQADASLKLRAKFVLAAMRTPSVSRRLASTERASPLGDLLSERPETIGNLLWPYQCASWNAEQRFDRITEHVKAVRKIPGLDLAPDEKLVLLDLSSISPDVSLILDRPAWLEREGHLTLSLFKGDFRAFTVSFSLSATPELDLFIGGLQGRQSDDILNLYRDLTKDFDGMRPRDFLLEALRLFALKIGVKHIYGVADDQKISRHKYFAGKETGGFGYDDVWLERGGERVAASHFKLPLEGSRRPLEEISSKKRSMYRKRYAMLDEIETRMPSDLTQAQRKRFDAQ
jgi:uncharacterized protein VirK/YbjX